jgi:eukaryotic-like serine/threonine-protein kinase
MSPEQVRGKQLDARSDLFSFGAVLYEMCTGMLPFRGDTAEAIFEAILNRAPAAVGRLNPEVPARLEEVISKSLEKDREVRYQSAAELRADLRRIEPDASSVNIASQGSPIKRPGVGTFVGKRRLGGALTLLVLVGLVGWLAWRQGERARMSEAPTSARCLSSNPTENPISAAAISPDGKYLAYADKTGAYLRLLPSGEVHTLLPKNDDVQFLSWYPDSTELLAAWPSTPTRKLGLWMLSILGGTPRRISDEGWWASVSPNSTQISFLKSAGFGETG